MTGDYYKGYQVNDTVNLLELSSKETNLLDACVYMVSCRSTIRKTAENFCISKSTLHRNIHDKLPSICYELYRCVLSILKSNSTEF